MQDEGALVRAVVELEQLATSSRTEDEQRLLVELPPLFTDVARAVPQSPLLARLVRLREHLLERDAVRYAGERRAIRDDRLRGAELLGWLLEQPSELRDHVVEGLLGVAHAPLLEAAPQLPPWGIAHHASSFGQVALALAGVPVVADDIFVDLGAGSGKVALLAHLLTGARARGVEAQQPLVSQAREAAAALGCDWVGFELADARDADLGDGTVFFMYLPFTGPVLDAVMQRLRAVAERREIVVCAIGLELAAWDWLAPRPPGSFWLSVYRSTIPGAGPRADRRSPLERFVEDLRAGVDF
ncbi:MAG TPA: class I SAM-dependent methyltransferase [Kofleriaceae bacterium]|nr:class I SAM-dependent methyltransferase [Kofleriaceae bacterium]